MNADSAFYPFILLYSPLQNIRSQYNTKCKEAINVFHILFEFSVVVATLGSGQFIRCEGCKAVTQSFSRTLQPNKGTCQMNWVMRSHTQYSGHPQSFE